MALAKAAAFGPVAPADAAGLLRLADALDGGAGTADLSAAPAEARRALAHLARLLAAGAEVSVGGVERLLSTSQAAALLGLSATYTIRLADEGVLPVEYRGTHRRFRTGDVLAYLATRTAPPPS